MRLEPRDAAVSADLADRSNLTHSQLLMWLGQQIDPDAALYNMVMTFEIEGPLDPGVFVRAFEAVAAATDALRIVVATDEAGVPQQAVRESPSVAVELVDLEGHADPAAACRQWVEGRKGRRFEPSERLVDVALLRLAPARHVWYLARHHLVTDGWSMSVVYQRTAEQYARLVRGGEDGAAAWPAFSDYVAHERAQRGTASHRKAEEFWRGVLAEPPRPLELYGPRGPSTPRSERVLVDLGPARTRRLREVAISDEFRSLSPDQSVHGIFATLLSAWLFRLGGNRRFAIGMPSHNRATPQFKRTAGLFLEVGPVVIDVEHDDTFVSLFKRTLPRVQLAMRFTRPGTTTAAHNRAYEVLLNFVNVSFAPFNGWPTRVEWVHAGFGDRAHALRLQVADFGASGSFTLHFDFNESAFTAAQRQYAVRDVLRLLDAFLDRPAATIADPPWLDEAERARLVEAFNRTGTPIPAGVTTLDLVAAHVARQPQAAAVVHRDRALSYRELDRRSNQLANRLRRLGVGPDAIVAVCTEHSIETVAATLGILKAGGAFLPLDPAWPRERLRFVLEDAAAPGSGAPLVVAQRQLVDRLPVDETRIVALDPDWQALAAEDDSPPAVAVGPGHLAYVIYTSGSTGQPKGVLVEHGNLLNYLCWARDTYAGTAPASLPLFTALTFDLTVTSMFLPLVTGGRVVVYRDDPRAPGSAMFDMIDEDVVDLVKLTPAHLALLRERAPGERRRATRARGLIVGGEDLKTEVARAAPGIWGGPLTVFNEYGPTEATVGCMVHRFDAEADRGPSVPVGRPAANARVYVLDRHGSPVPPGVVGEMAIGGAGVARGYLNRPELTAQRFVTDPLVPGGRMYLTGDRARWDDDGRLAFLGRADDQVKIAGVRVELGEIEAALLRVPGVRHAVVAVVEPKPVQVAGDLRHCERCGLASDFPSVAFDERGVCSTCRAFDGYRDRASVYFRPEEELRRIADRMKASRRDGLDCVVLYSGGKDSTYMLYRLVDLGLRPLAFTLDNGYISDEAKANISRVAEALGIEHVFGTTPAMREIFVDSLRQHANVCNGCFKTIYTLAIDLARRRGLRFIVTGLSRGQFFETRLTGDLFEMRDIGAADIDRLILEARRAYHRRDDAVSRGLDVDVFRGDQALEDVEFVDFYRYVDVDLDTLYAFLRERAPWIRPRDTGRSTNCLINDVGIWMHRRQRGYHNYALPYSWDVRLGHKTREQALEELDDEIDERSVKRILAEIGYDEPSDEGRAHERRLAAYFVADRPLASQEVRAVLARSLPDALVPSFFVQLDALPLTPHGKVDRRALPAPDGPRRDVGTPYVEPATELERRLAEIWAGVLRVDRVGVHDNFFELGGDSIQSIQLVARAARAGIRIAPAQLFRHQTIAELARVAEWSSHRPGTGDSHAGRDVISDDDRHGADRRTPPSEPFVEAGLSQQEIADVLSEFGEPLP